MVNRLAAASSPYLLQHVDNPVDWYEWGDEAFEEARRRGVPIFLSVGYSACHWCHVMAHESFEDDEVAAMLNAAFVNVKVDREERPDVDAVYMRAVQSMTGRGGWPMSVFLTPGGAPFYAGTYWPREPRHGMPDFPRVITAVAEAWEQRRDEVLSSAASVADAIDRHRDLEPATDLDVEVADAAARLVVDQAWDRQLGGFGRAPKFPQAMTIEWLLHRHARTGEREPLEAAVHSLDAMARGGIHDHLAGGFARYSTDARWLVPHFEKMLYDNALLLAAYATAARLAIDADERAAMERTARTTAAFLLDDLRGPDGTFHAALDADSEGEEGRFYVWSLDEVLDVLAGLDVDQALWTRYLGVSSAGNWEGTNVLHEPVAREQFARDHGREPTSFAVEWDRVRRALLERRGERVHPGLDDKVLTDWNALAVRGLVVAGRLLEEPSWIEAGARAAEVLHERHVVDGRLQHTSRAGRVAVPAFLEDHALLALADLELLAATGEPVWYDRAVALARDADVRFHDDVDGGWFTTAEDAEVLFTRPKETWDNATPSGTSVMVEVCQLLAALSGEAHWAARAEEGIRLLQGSAATMPTGYGWLLRQVEALAAGPREVAIVGPAGPARDALVAVVATGVHPGVASVVADPDHGDRVPLLAHRGPVDGAPAAYVCRQMVCERPVTSPAELGVALGTRSPSDGA